MPQTIILAMQILGGIAYSNIWKSGAKASESVATDRTSASSSVPAAAGTVTKNKEPAGSPPAARIAAETARDKINEDAARAAASGQRIVYDTANGGRFPDFSTLTESELGAVAKGGGFSQDEALVAKAELSMRMDKLLGSLGDNPRAIAIATKAIYPALDASAREALGWDEKMLKGADAIISYFGPKETSSESESLLARLTRAQQSPCTFKFDASLISQKGSTVDLTA